MATKIKSIPILEGISAKNFIDKSKENLKLSKTIDFNKESRIMIKILEKAKIK